MEDGIMRLGGCRIVGAICVLLLVTMACAGESEIVSSPVQPTDTTSEPFTDGPFQIDLPDWPSVPSDDEATLIALGSTSGWGVAVARQPLVPRPFGWYLPKVLPGHGDFRQIHVDDSHIGRVVVEARLGQSPVMGVRFVLVYCGGSTYQISGSAPETDFPTFLAFFQTVLDSAACSHSPAKADAGNGLVGVILTPSNNDFSFANLRRTVVEAYDAGVRGSHIYLNWSTVETEPEVYDWTFSDVMMDTMSLEGLRLSLVIEFIHTSVLGETPDDLEGKSLDDPEYRRRAVAFAAAVAERYGEQLDYLELGNEVNIYFQDHPNDIQAFLDLVTEARAAVHAVRPDLPVGTVLAFHELMAGDRLDLIDTFKFGDFLAYTYYPHAPGFRYDGDPGVFAGVLDQMIERSGDTPFIIVENGWATAPSLGGSEERQAEYIRATFAALAERRGAFGWHLWFGFHDGEQSICEEGGLSFLPPETDPDSLGDAWGYFVDYLCTLGLKHYDSTPKLGWEVFKEELAKYEAGF